jgi:hypothetical protein
MKRKLSTETPVCPQERLVIISYTTGLSFALERIGSLAAITIIVFYLLVLYLLALPNTPENPFASIYSESLIKTTCQHLLLLVGFDTLIYRKYYDTPPVLVGHQYPKGVPTSLALETLLELQTRVEFPNVKFFYLQFLQSLISLILNIPGKSKDNVKARFDVEKFCDRKILHREPPTSLRKIWFKLHAKYCLDSIQKREAFRWLKYVVMFPDGYCSNISKGVNLLMGKVTGLKSHDYDIWIERLMPVMVRGYLPEKVWRVLPELSNFFHTLYAK